jgi:hypothetical protein
MMPKSNKTQNTKERNVLDMPVKSISLSKELESLLDNYELTYHVAGAVIFFRSEPTLASISEIRSFLDELTEDLIQEII